MLGIGRAPTTVQVSVSSWPRIMELVGELMVTSTGAKTRSSWRLVCRGRLRSVLEASQVITLFTRVLLTEESLSILLVMSSSLQSVLRIFIVVKLFILL